MDTQEQECLLPAQPLDETTSSKIHTRHWQVLHLVFEAMLVSCILGLSVRLATTTDSHGFDVKTPVPNCMEALPTLVLFFFPPNSNQDRSSL